MTPIGKTLEALWQESGLAYNRPMKEEAEHKHPHPEFKRVMRKADDLDAIVKAIHWST